MGYYMTKEDGRLHAEFDWDEPTSYEIPGSAPLDDIFDGFARNGRGPSQQHIFADGRRQEGDNLLEGGDDVLNLRFQPITQLSNGHHVYGQGGHDTFNFADTATIGHVVMGRIDDFDASRDTIQIDGIAIDLDNPPSNVTFVLWNGEFDDDGAEPQYWIRIETSGGGTIFYALEGARIDEDDTGGANNSGPQERHFMDLNKFISPADAGDLNAINAFLDTLPEVDFVDPHNIIPDGYSPDGGIIITDLDKEQAIDTGDAHDFVDEIILGTSSGDLISAGLNNDHVQAGAGNDKVWGGSGSDTLEGQAGNDLLAGNRGDDTLSGGIGSDTFVFEGLFGNDVITDFDEYDDNEKIDLTNVSGIVDWADLSANHMADVGNDVEITDGNGNTITLNNTHFSALDANDFIFDAQGVIPSSAVEGTSGNDVINSAYVDTDGDTMSDGDDVAYGFAGDDHITGHKGDDQIFGGDGDDTINGIKHNNILHGDDGSDTIYSGQHASELFGGTGDDHLFGSMAKGGGHELTGGSGTDVFEFTNASSNKVDDAIITDFNLNDDTLIVLGQTVDFVGSQAGITLTDNSTGVLVEYGDDDFIMLNGVDLGPNGQVDGSSSDDNMSLGFTDGQGEAVTNGDDIIFGFAGNDDISGGKGDDQIFGGDGDDVINGNKHNNMLYGDAGDDDISSGQHASELFGGTGDDHLTGVMAKGGGHEFTGGSGADVFEFVYASSNKVDDAVITDFEANIDTLILMGQTVDFVSPQAGITLNDSGANMFVNYGDDDFILLQGVNSIDFV